MFGLFVRKQARAVSQNIKVGVVAVFAKEQNEKYIIEHHVFEQSLPEVRVYFKSSSTGIFNGIRTFRAYRKGIKLYIEKYGIPDIIHANIFTRTAVIACRTARKLRVPFVVSEHWSRYYPENFSYKGFLRKLMTKKSAHKAKAVIVPSEALKDAMVAVGIQAKYEIVPNVIETDVFKLAKKNQKDIKHIVHVSCFEDKSKNISGLIRSVQALLQHRNDFILHLVGTGQDEEKIKLMVSEMLPKGVVEFHGMLDGGDLSEVMSQADFMVLSSRYETFGIVVYESLACGVPVLVTDVAGLGGIISAELGMIVKVGDDEALAVSMSQMLDKCQSYDQETMRKFVLNGFSAEAVAAQLVSIYNFAIEQK